MTRPWDAARIAEARARCEAATPGPCKSCETRQRKMEGQCPTCAAARARFEMSARTDLPEALDEIERLRAEITLLRPVWYAAQAWRHGCAPETELEIAVDAVDEAINDGFEFLPLTPPPSDGTVPAMKPPPEQG